MDKALLRGKPACQLDQRWGEILTQIRLSITIRDQISTCCRRFSGAPSIAIIISFSKLHRGLKNTPHPAHEPVGQRYEPVGLTTAQPHKPVTKLPDFAARAFPCAAARQTWPTLRQHMPDTRCHRPQEHPAVHTKDVIGAGIPPLPETPPWRIPATKQPYAPRKSDVTPCHTPMKRPRPLRLGACACLRHTSRYPHDTAKIPADAAR